jgi:hypothetical protein
MIAALAAVITAAILAALVIGIIMMFVGSVMRFILFDSIIARECHIRWNWSRRLGPGWRYFIWKVGYILLALVGMGLVVGIPAAVAFSNGWFKEPRAHLPGLLFVGFLVFLVFFIFAVITALILVLTKDFVVPQMALENLDAMEGWRRLWRMMKAEQGAYAAYIGMKIVLAIVASIFIAIATAILGVMIAIPSIALGLLALLTGKAAGLTWNAPTITLAVVVGCLLLGVFLYLVSLLSVPVIVFFPAYSMYFFAARYPQLAAVLYPALPTGQVANLPVPSS